jgi:hypothetical protein
VISDLWPSKYVTHWKFESVESPANCSRTIRITSYYYFCFGLKCEFYYQRPKKKQKKTKTKNQPTKQPNPPPSHSFISHHLQDGRYFYRIRPLRGRKVNILYIYIYSELFILPLLIHRVRVLLLIFFFNTSDLKKKRIFSKYMFWVNIFV